MHDDLAPPPRRPDGPPPSGLPRARPPLREPPPDRPLPAVLVGVVVLALLAAGVRLGVGLLRGDPGPPPPTTPSGARVETIERLAAATVSAFRTADRELFLRRCVELAEAFP